MMMVFFKQISLEWIVFFICSSLFSKTSTQNLPSFHQSIHPSMASSSTVSTTLDLHLSIRPKPRPIFSQNLRNSNKRFTILCNSSVPQSPPNSQPNPSLAEQLKPLSLNLLSEKPKPQLNLLSKPKSIWVNPSKPKRTVLNLQRHKRSVYSHNPQLKDLKLFCHKLNETDPSSESEFLAALEEIPHPPDRENALVILNSLKPWPKPIFFLNWLKTQNLFPIETIFYNVAIKSLRSAKQFELVEELAEEMVRNEVKLDNITYSTIITCAKRCSLFDKAVEWFEKMYKSGLMPDEVTYSAILDVYAKLGRVEEVMSLYERARASGWKPDSIAFSILGKMYGEAGDYDGIRFVLKEMKSVGVAPNVVVYNTLLDAMGKAGKPGLARSLFEEMVGSGLTPNEKTLTALVKIYGKARWGRDALELWDRMKMNGWRMDFMLYNTLLTMCAELGLEEEAEELFEAMKNTRYSKAPDSWSYTAMLNIYGKGGNVEKAMKIFDEMAELGVKLNVMGCTCLIQCLGKANRIEDVVKVFEFAVERGVQPDDRLCGCLLSVVALCVKTEEVRMVLDLLEKSNPKLVSFIALISDKEVGFEVIKEEMKEIMNGAAVEVRRPFCNCLIDICRNRNLNERAQELLYLGTLYGLYPGMHSKTSEEWSLNLRSLSVGAAYTAFEEWMGSLSKIVDRDESLPALFSAHTGSGTHRFSQGLCSSFAAHVKKLDAPFRQSEENVGCFVATREDVMSWVQSRAPSASAVGV